MAGHTILLNLLGGVALLLWAMRTIRDGMLRGFGDQLRLLLSEALGNRVRACLSGLAVTLLLQSSSGTALMLGSFAERGLVAVSAGLAVMLGADIGSALVVQILSFDVAVLTPILLLAGVALVRVGRNGRITSLGSIVVGLGLLLLSFRLIGAASEPIRDNALIATLFAHLAGDPILALVLGAGLTWLFHSSVAFILLVVALMAGGSLPFATALALVLGANVGSGLIAFGLTLGSAVTTRRIVLGNALFRLGGAVVALTLLGPVARWLETLPTSAGTSVALFHLGFNVALALAILPFTGPCADLLTRLLPDPRADRANPLRQRLDEKMLADPAVAIAEAARAVVRMGDTVEIMLSDAIRLFETADADDVQKIHRLDDRVDAQQSETKLFLARLSRSELDPEQARRVRQLIEFGTSLEHVGDVIDNGLVALARKKQAHMLNFSEEGWRELRAFHGRIVDHLRLAMTMLVHPSLANARRLVQSKDQIRRAEKEATENHFDRLRSGQPRSIETSSLHLDVLRDLKRIAAYLTSAAYPELEEGGAIRESRLRSVAVEEGK